MVSLREEERRLQLALAELEMQLDEQQRLVQWLENALDRTQLDTDRRLTQQQKEHERSVQLLLQQSRGAGHSLKGRPHVCGHRLHLFVCTSTPAEQIDEGLAGKQRQFEGWIHNLSKELNHYKAVNVELSNKLKELSGSTSQSKERGKYIPRSEDVFEYEH